MASLPTGNVAARPPGGPPKKSTDAASGPPNLRPKPWWLIFLALMVANYLLVRVFFSEPSSITIPYTVFKKQVQGGNVQDVTSVGDSIQGTFKAGVTYPLEEPQAPSATAPASRSSDRPAPRTSTEFRTQRPAFADPGLETLLEEKGVVIKALDESAAPRRRAGVGCSGSAGAAPSATASSSRRSPSTTSPESTRPRTS
jgi:cell division protease FtsH